jgi:hypothetical protein
MSQWVHIAGIIRFDQFQIGEDEFSPHPKDFLGNTFNHLDDKNVKKKCNVPYGSEGSLQYEIIPERRGMYLDTYSVVFHGDLRDKGDEIIEEMKEYLERISRGQMIRQGIIEVEIEGSETKLFQYRGKNWLIK